MWHRIKKGKHNTNTLNLKKTVGKKLFTSDKGAEVCGLQWTSVSVLYTYVKTKNAS